jgi:hypothetical protein
MAFKLAIGLAIFLAAAGSVLAADDSKKLTLMEVPTVVQKAITGHIGDGQLGEITKTNEPGEMVFEVTFTPKGGDDDRDFTVADDGTPLSEEVTLTEAPDAVQKMIRAQATGWELESIEKNLDGSEVSYDVEVTKDSRDRTFSVSDDGVVMSDSVTLAVTPAAVQMTIQSQITNSSAPSISEIFDSDGNSFDVETTGKNHKSFSVAEDGQLLSEEVSLKKLPPSTRKAIEEKIGAGKVLRIDKCLVEKKKGVLPYEVQGRKDGKPFDFSVGPKGRFLGMDDE